MMNIKYSESGACFSNASATLNGRAGGGASSPDAQGEQPESAKDKHTMYKRSSHLDMDPPAPSKAPTHQKATFLESLDF